MQSQSAVVAAVQMVSGADLDANLAQAGQLIARAASAGARLVVLPETFALFDSRGQAALAAEEAGARPRVRAWLAEQARSHGLWIVAGTLPLPADDGRVRAACLVLDSSGVEVARYDKTHLFDVDVADLQGSYRESATFQPGERLVVVDTPVGRVGLAVCYDLRFPELFRRLRAAGADLFAIPAAFTRHTGLAHWLPLLRARAIENQVMVIGANQGGQHSEHRATSGGSAIIDHWGEVMAEVALGPACIVAGFDIGAQTAARQRMPCHQHRRTDLIGP